jgi:D-glycero-beta-D-manno-heptose 1-phosphate adenylyltransferase
MPMLDARAKVLQRKDLARRSEELRRKGKKLVLTNGCFELLHVGHIRYLERARALGDALAVGLNGDESVRRLKGAGRPVTPEGDRSEVVAALQAVDYVVIFDEDTAEELVEDINPAVYVKGGDYSANPEDANYPPEGLVMRRHGGEVTIVRLQPGYSTTAALKKLGTRTDKHEL